MISPPSLYHSNKLLALFSSVRAQLSQQDACQKKKRRNQKLNPSTREGGRESEGAEMACRRWGGTGRVEEGGRVEKVGLG